MCVSNEPCRLKEEKSAVLAQSTFRRFYLIGRTLDRAGKLGNPVPARRGKRESKAYRQEAGMPDSPGKLKAFPDEHGE